MRTAIMAINESQRSSIICSLLPDRIERLIDVGCGPITPDYPYAKRAEQITCIDWKLKVFGTIPSNITPFEGNFSFLDLEANSCDTIIAADVFEHILLEEEDRFVKKCETILRPGGHVIISVP